MGVSERWFNDKERRRDASIRKANENCWGHCGSCYDRSCALHAAQKVESIRKFSARGVRWGGRYQDFGEGGGTQRVRVVNVDWLEKAAHDMGDDWMDQRLRDVDSESGES